MRNTFGFPAEGNYHFEISSSQYYEPFRDGKGKKIEIKIAEMP